MTGIRAEPGGPRPTGTSAGGTTPAHHEQTARADVRRGAPGTSSPPGTAGAPGASGTEGTEGTEGTDDTDDTGSADGAGTARRLAGATVVAVVRDEEDHLDAMVRSALVQDYDGRLELVLAVGPSRDRTAQIARDWARRDGRITVVDNPTGGRSTGLNLAICAADPRTDVVIRVDGHAVLPVMYVRRAIRTLERTGAANVGGMMLPVGTTSTQRAVARAMRHPAGIGAAAFHTGGAEGEVATVYLGAFRRDALLAVGGYDETIVRGEDWELNRRLRSSGRGVWFDPALHVVYYPRSSLRDLGRQFWRTGMWRREIVRREPRTAGLRYLAPPALVLALALSVLTLVVGASLAAPWVRLGLAVPVLYALAVLVASWHASRRETLRIAALLPAVLVTMHLAWGAGFLRGVPRASRDEHRT
ncbi:glycosyltransferase family 2 protein [Cellulosimicrobium arenosum]|uniref:Glycosyltransferase family 2 protein n=1 Tax=Cellulosimicrobium arenosum TaxID=2708133 RepID=A0A927G735_9MICO|nr:glycosyltransferase family 2 protein [Cellulosimicrobium arenosum]MBD8078062.1 glycosyltransferase family 2 protein [Cellulosimicrobium arenosum]